MFWVFGLDNKAWLKRIRMVVQGVQAKEMSSEASRGAKGEGVLKQMLLWWVVWMVQQSQAANAEIMEAKRSMVVVGTRMVGGGEMQALQDLKKALGVREDLWGSHAYPCTEWAGVSCSRGHVVSLNASGFQLPHGLPPSFGLLSHLQLLDLTATSLQGTIPAPLPLLTHLTFLSLAHNNLSGPLFPALDTLSNLEYLDLSWNHFTGSLPTAFFSNASHLLSIDLSYNLLTGTIPSALGELPSLQSLTLQHNLLEGTLELQQLNLPQLTHLDVSYNNLSGSLSPAIGSLKSLTFLNLAKNHFNGLIPSHISDCSGLQVLILSHNVLTGELPLALTTLATLVNLSLSFNSLKGSLPPGLFTLPKLMTLDLSHNLFYGPLSFKEGHAIKVRVFDVSYNFLNGSIPGGFTIESTRKNCFHGVPKQHSMKACQLFYNRNGLPLNNLLPQGVLPQGSSIPSKISEAQPYRSKHFIVILGGATGGAFLLVCAGALVLCFFYRHEGELHSKAKGQSGEANPGRTSDTDLWSINYTSLGEAFSLEVLHQATKNFSPSCIIASGHSGDFYKGTLDGGADVVVKRIKNSKLMEELLLRELEVCRRASHSRLVSVLGYCLDVPEEKFLIYKYMCNGDLASALHPKAPSEENQPQQLSLDWITRLKIAISAAEGLSYLHHECSPPIIHRNVKSSSILLDDKFEVRLGSLSDALVDEDSHPGPIPCFPGFSWSFNEERPGLKTESPSMDVYNFGKVLLEIISGKNGISDQSDPQADLWLEWALSFINVHERGDLFQLLDPSLIVYEDFLYEVWAVAIVAKACLSPKPSKRPSMRHVLKALENPHKVTGEGNLEEMMSGTSSQNSWNEALFRDCRAASMSQRSETFTENRVGSLHRENSILMTQNISYVTEARQIPSGDIQEIVYKT